MDGAAWGIGTFAKGLELLLHPEQGFREQHSRWRPHIFCSSEHKVSAGQPQPKRKGGDTVAAQSILGYGIGPRTRDVSRGRKLFIAVGGKNGGVDCYID